MVAAPHFTMTTPFLNERLGKRGPPLASIESLLSFEAKSTPRFEILIYLKLINMEL